MKIVLASHNPKKLRELSDLLGDTAAGQYELVLPQDVGLHDEAEETGKTFMENALIKARAISRHGYIAIADDSGLCVDALNGEPGIYSARYSGKGDEANIDLLLSRLNGLDDSARTAHFTCCMVCTLPGKEESFLAVQEICQGRILTERQGNGGFGYDPVFFSFDLQKGFGEATPQEKNEVSHRGRACRKFADCLPDFIGAWNEKHAPDTPKKP